MIMGSVPLSIFASDGGGSATGSGSDGTVTDTDTKPIVTVESLLHYPVKSDSPEESDSPDESDSPEESDFLPEDFFRALPDDDGIFYFDISLDPKPTTDEEIIVYYRTIDDTAVAAWGDYESVGALEEAYVVLNKTNGYKERVVVHSTVLDYASIGTDGLNSGMPSVDSLVSRRFIFELTRVEGNAKLHEPESDAGTIEHRNKSRLYCYLRANTYIRQSNQASYFYIDREYWELPHESFKGSIISTPYIYGHGSMSGSLNIQVPEHIKSLIATGDYKLGVSIIGMCYEDYWNSDGPVTFDLYYTYQGKKQKAITVIVEGEFDDSKFFGFEHAFDYVSGDRYDDAYKGYNIKDFINDNFYGFILYDNDGNVSYKVTKDSSRDVSKIKEALQQTIRDGFSFSSDNSLYNIHTSSTAIFPNNINWLLLPSNFAFADSYSWTFETKTGKGEEDEGRRLEDVMVVISAFPNKELMIETNDMGYQMVATNIDQMKDGDNLKLAIRFNQLAYIDTRAGNPTITAKINNKYDVTLELKQMVSPDCHYAFDTVVFEGKIPEEVKDIRITSLTDIKLNYKAKSNNKKYEFKSFMLDESLIATTIKDIFGYNKDTRTPLAMVNVTSTEKPTKSKSLDIYVNTVENTSARFNDYVTVYYQWSNNSKYSEPPHSSKLVFHTNVDGDVSKTIIGTGTGAMYLHIKAVSSYGKSSISTFGPYNFDNSPPELSADDIEKTGTMKDRTISFELPNDNGGAGLQDAHLYYIPKNSEDGVGTLLKKFTADDFTGTPRTLTHTISHRDVGIGVDPDGNVTLERGEITFYWLLSDKLGNLVERTAEFSLVFDTNDYLSEEIAAVGPYDAKIGENTTNFSGATQTIDELNFIYDYTNEKIIYEYPEPGKSFYYGFAFKIDTTFFDGTDYGDYTAKIYYEGAEYTDFSLVKTVEGTYTTRAVIFHSALSSGRYDIQLFRKEGDSQRVSRIYSVYATNGEADNTEVKKKVENGTLLSNSVYQLSTKYYYKDEKGNIITVDYNNTKYPASFSTYEKAKEYVYYKELGDIYLIQLSAATASALTSGTTGYLIANGETVTPEAGQYWIRYKSESWTPTSGDSSWVYYYYGTTDKLSEGALSRNLQNALNVVSKRIVDYGSSVILTDTSILFGSTSGNGMLDKYGMPYLALGQIHSDDEISANTMCGNVWSVEVAFAADKNIYKSVVYVGEEESPEYAEYPIIGNFAIPEGSIFQYMTYDEYKSKKKETKWTPLVMKKGETFIDVLRASNVYYIREISNDGVSVFAIYVDKEAPKVTFSNTNERGELNTIPVDPVEILDIRTKDLIIGNIDATEYDRLSYVAIYKVSNLALVGVYTANDLESSHVKLEDGNYYIVISDRSGNHYTVTARVSSTELECIIKESEDKHIKLTCNRRKDQILRYEVYLNGELVTSTYEPDQTFTEAGSYRIYIQDIFGNEFLKEEYIFERNYPDVTWKYVGSDGRFHTYDPEAEKIDGFVMEELSANSYKISTSVKTRFTYTGNYEFEFIGTVPEFETSMSGGEAVVTIEAGQSFTLKVYYKNHKDCYNIYSGVVDITPPSINVSADVDVLQNGEYGDFSKLLSEKEVGDVIKMNDIYYVLSEVGHRNVLNGGIVSSDIIRINVSDANELSLIEVYLDDTLLKRQDEKTVSSEIVVSKWGNYRIVAKDIFNNIKEFTFTNGNPSDLEYFVDGVEGEIELHGYLLFNDAHDYTKVDFGNSDLVFDMNKDGDVFMSVAVSGGSAEIYGFRIFEGKIYSLTYTVVLDKKGEKTFELTMGESPLLDMKTEKFDYTKEYALNPKGAHTIYASIDSEGLVSFKVYASEDPKKIVYVEARFGFAGSSIAFVSAELSKKVSNVTFNDLEGNNIGTTESKDDVRINNGFVIDSSMFDLERISEVKLYHSERNDLDPDSLSGKRDIYGNGKEYSAEGVYLLVIKNSYGIESYYKIAISRSFGILSTVTFTDGQKVNYTKDYEGTLYSNNEITLDITEEGVTHQATRNGEVYNTDAIVKKGEDGFTYLVFREAGSYVVKLTDSYGNEVTKNLEIEKSSYTVPDELLTGYNEKALKRDEGYTNQKLSIDGDVFAEAEIYYLAIKYGDKLTVLFDSFAEESIKPDTSEWIDVIGNDGDGIYAVIIRNRWGAIVTKNVNYRATPTLQLERTIRSSAKSESYALEHALSLGFWSNNTLVFNTDAKLYVFTINGSVTECPRTLVFENSGDFGSSEYDIKYIDEYGFEYNFKAYLVRKNVTIELSKNITGIDVNGVLNTQNDISVIFGENIYATYTINGGEDVLYRSGEVLKKDGTYRFTVIDYAGNTTTLVIKKDTIPEFSLIESGTGNAVQNGGIVNSSKVDFKVVNRDSAYIEKVLKNGIVQKDYTDSKFTEDGKWELIVCDKLGNKSYFCFYIVTRSQNGFSYTTPYEYRITEMWYDGGEGNKISYMSFVSHDEYTSSFNFIENGKYKAVMTSSVTGNTSTFEFTINTNAPEVSLVGCNVGETTINDVSLAGCKVGDRISIYRIDDGEEKLVQKLEITSASTRIPTITEGGNYRIVVESEAGVPVEFTFVRKHVMNTAGSVFIMIIIGCSVIGLFTGLVYRNKSKTDE